MTVEWFLRREKIDGLECNTDYKYHSKDMHFRWKIWRLELLGTLGVMGESLQSAIPKWMPGMLTDLLNLFQDRSKKSQ